MANVYHSINVIRCLDRLHEGIDYDNPEVRLIRLMIEIIISALDKRLIQADNALGFTYDYPIITDYLTDDEWLIVYSKA